MRKDGHVSRSEAGLSGRGKPLVLPGRDTSFRSSSRLRGPEQFAGVFAFRKSFSSEHFQLLYRPNGLGGARLGMVVPKKHAMLAVRRNLVKRLCRTSFRMWREELPSHDLVLRLTRKIDGPERAALKAEIDQLMARLCESSSSHPD